MPKSVIKRENKFAKYPDFSRDGYGANSHHNCSPRLQSGVSPDEKIGINSANKNEIEIRRVRIDDISTIVEIEKDSYPDPWSVKMFERELQLEFSNFFVAIENREIAGYICFWTVSDEGQIANITVKEKFRRKGLGSRIMKYIIDSVKAMKIKKMFLEVRAINYPALKLYEKFGFQKIDVRKKYYSNSDDAVVMAKTL